MSINTVVHINLRGDARAALEFYQSVFGGNLVAVTYQDAHNVQNPDEANQIMWGEVVSDDGFHVMAYDVPSATAYYQGEIRLLRLGSRHHLRRDRRLLGQAQREGHRQGTVGARRFLAPLRHGHRPVRCHLGPRRRCRLQPFLGTGREGGHADGSRARLPSVAHTRTAVAQRADPSAPETAVDAVIGLPLAEGGSRQSVARITLQPLERMATAMTTCTDNTTGTGRCAQTW